MANLTDRDDWFELWFEGKKAAANAMARDMAADLIAGADYFGDVVQNQKGALEEYRKQLDFDLDGFKYMSHEQVNRWCYYDMRKRGVLK